MNNIEMSTEEIINDLSFYALSWNYPEKQKLFREFVIRYKKIKTELNNHIKENIELQKKLKELE